MTDQPRLTDEAFARYADAAADVMAKLGQAFEAYARSFATMGETLGRLNPGRRRYRQRYHRRGRAMRRAGH